MRHYLAGSGEELVYAIGGFRHSTTARVTVTPPSAPGQRPTVEVEHQLHIVDRYDWDTGRGVTIGPFSISDTELGELHRKGLAQEYEVRGTSGVVTVEAPLDPSAPPPPEGDVPVPGNGGRDEVELGWDTDAVTEFVGHRKDVDGLIRELLVDLTTADRAVVYLHAYTA